MNFGGTHNLGPILTKCGKAMPVFVYQMLKLWVGTVGTWGKFASQGHWAMSGDILHVLTGVRGH